MQELVKSMVRFPWALSMFSLHQAVEMWPQKEGNATDRLAEGFNSVSTAAEGRLKGWMKDTYEAGDRIGKETVNLAWKFTSSDALDVGKMMQETRDAFNNVWDAVKKLLPEEEAA